MSEHYNKVIQTTKDARNAMLNSPEVKAEIARVRKAIESAAEKGGFYCYENTSKREYNQYVVEILSNEGYSVADRGEGCFISWDGK